jgi:hypothetical protein
MRSIVKAAGRPIIACLGLIGVAAFCSFGAIAAPSGNFPMDQPQVAPTTVVVGADDPSIDVPAVQSAVDQGGTVILRGTFDFGTDAGNHIIVPGRPYPDQDRKGDSTVFIYQKDVTIVGETGERGELLTVVKNGMPAFWIGWDGEVSRVPPPGTEGVDYGKETFPVDELGRVNYRDTGREPDYTGSQTRYARAFQDVSATIKTIFFESPKHYGVKATAGRDVFVNGNTFSKVQYGGLVHLNNFAGATRVAGGFAGIGMLYAPFLAPVISGSIVAERNVVDDVGTEIINTHSGECLGLGAIGTIASVRFERNEVRNVGRQASGAGPVTAANSIFLVDNYKVAPIVAHNFVYNSSGMGIHDLVLLAPTPGPRIEHNTLVDCEIGIFIYSFVGPMEGRFIHQNLFSQDGLLGSGQSCITAIVLSASLVRSNMFEGDYSGPLVVLLSSGNNILLENRDLRSAIPQVSPTYYLDASSLGNLVVSASGTALDLGADNRIFLQSPGVK